MENQDSNKQKSDVGLWAIAAMDIERIHAPMDGEAQLDPNKYCRTCVGPNGRAKIYPCKTVKVIRAAAATPSDTGE